MSTALYLRRVRAPGLAVVLALSLVATACSGGSSPAADEAGDTAAEQVATPSPTVELIPLPTATVEPTPDPSPTSTPEPVDDPEDTEAADDKIVWTHIEDFDLVFQDGRVDLATAVTTFYDVGGGDIPTSVDALLDSMDHPLRWQDAADAAVATFPEGLGESAGIFALLSTQWSVIGCESHLAGMNVGRWNKLLFDHLVAEAAGLPSDQADNQAGIMLEATNAAIVRLCPRLVP